MFPIGCHLVNNSGAKIQHIPLAAANQQSNERKKKAQQCAVEDSGVILPALLATKG